MNAPLPATRGITLLVVCGQQGDAVRAETLLRNRGWAAQHIWACDTGEAREALARAEPDLVLCSTDADLDGICELARQRSSDMPVIAMAGRGDAARDAGLRARCLHAGAADVVTPGSGTDDDCFEKICARELRAVRNARALRRSQMRIAEFISRHRALVNDASQALLTLSEGIIVEVNPAAARLLGIPDAGALLQQPLLDLAAPESLPELRERLAKLQKGRINDAELDCSFRTGGDTATIAVAVQMSSRRSAGELLIDVVLAPVANEREESEGTAGEQSLAERCDAAVRLISDTMKGGEAHGVLYAVIDGFAAHQQRIGLLASARMADTWQALLADALPAGTAHFRLGAAELCIVMPCPGAEALEGAAAELCARTRQQSFSTGDFDCHVTSSIAAYLLHGAESVSADDALRDCCVEARDFSRSGGDGVRSIGTAARAAAEERDAREQAEFIRESLESSTRFYLAFQRISCLGDDRRDLYDVLVRMTDDQQNELQAREFLPVAQRYGLMPAIDRWVFADALAKLAKRRDAPIGLMLRMAEESLAEYTTLLDLLRECAPKAGALAVQLREPIVQRQLKAVTGFREGLRSMNVEFVLDYYGDNPGAASLLERVRPDYVKFAPDFARQFDEEATQARLHKLIKTAREHEARIIIPFIEDTRVMGQLWQMGIHYVQGDALQGAEAVMLASERA